MIQYRKALSALLVGVLLSMVAPAAIYAADSTPHATTAATATPINVNLLQNPGFETVGTAGSIPGWTPTGDVRVETFGTRHWPTPAYAKKWQGGKRYLACETSSGQVSQTVNYVAPNSNTWRLVRLSSYFGGALGHQIIVTLTVTDKDWNVLYTNSKLRTLDVTDHYLKDVVTAEVAPTATHITATVQLIRKGTAKTCKIVSDTTDMWVFPPPS